MTTTQKAPTGRGRPKTFDREKVLDIAMALFWRYGYESTSMSELVKATQSKPGTLYSEFGSKEGLFCASVERYLSVYRQKYYKLMEQESLSVKEIIDQLIHALADFFTDPLTPQGCFMVSASYCMAPEDAHLADLMKQKCSELENNIHTFLQQRKEKAEFPPSTDTDLLANYLYTLLKGMSARARNGASRECLQQNADLFMAMWPQLCELCQIPQRG